MKSSSEESPLEGFIDQERRTEYLTKKIAVVSGGLPTWESYDLSLRCGEETQQALVKRGYDATLIVMDGVRDVWNELREFDVVFPVGYGPTMADGAIQGLLEILKKPYCFSGVTQHAILFDKIRTKRYLEGNPDIQLVPSQTIFKHTHETRIEMPVMVKDPQKGCSTGVSRCETQDEVRAARDKADSDHGILVERFIDGIDIVACVLDGVKLPVMEFKTELAWQNLESKNQLWNWDGKENDCPDIVKICPSTLPKEVTERAQNMCLSVYKWLGCEGALNCEFRVDKNDFNKIYFIETSSIPGWTSQSVHAECALAADICWEDVCERVLLSARLKVDGK